MKKAPFILIFAIALICNPAKAQFKKALTPTYNKVYSSEAKFNVGITGGLTTTRWFHFGGTNTPYKQPFNFGIVGGVVVEYMLNSSSSVAVEGFFAMRNTQLNYEVLNFPVAINQSKNYYRQFDVKYQNIEVQVPYTYYFGQHNFKPYVFVGPRFSMPLSGEMNWTKKEILNYGTPNQQFNPDDTFETTVEMNAQNTRQWNVGVVLGAGVLFKINLSNYYFIVKVDASAHADVINSFTKEEIAGTSVNVIGASYIDPYLLGKRFNSDATVKLSLLFPLKKQLKGACMKWGEYD